MRLFLFPYLLFLCTKAALFLCSLHSHPSCSGNEQRSTGKGKGTSGPVCSHVGTHQSLVHYLPVRTCSTSTMGHEWVGDSDSPSNYRAQVGGCKDKVMFLHHSLDLLHLPQTTQSIFRSWLLLSPCLLVSANQQPQNLCQALPGRVLGASVHVPCAQPAQHPPSWGRGDVMISNVGSWEAVGSCPWSPGDGYFDLERTRFPEIIVAFLPPSQQ